MLLSIAPFHLSSLFLLILSISSRLWSQKRVPMMLFTTLNVENLMVPNWSLMTSYMLSLWWAAHWMFSLLPLLDMAICWHLLETVSFFLSPIKTTKDATISANYCAIALAWTLSNALEWCILLVYKDWFKTSELQFEFKAKMSTFFCTGILKCIVTSSAWGLTSYCLLSSYLI